MGVQMLVKELIEKLQAANPDAEVRVAVGTYTQAFPVAYVEPFMTRQCDNGNFRIYANLENNQYVVTRKSKAA